MNKDFREIPFGTRVKARIHQTILEFLKPGFITWVIGTILIVRGDIPCNSATEYAWYTGGLIAAIGVHKVLKHKNGG